MALTTINSGGVKDDSIVNADIKSDAAIAGTKVAPDFGSQNIITTGNVGIGTGSGTSTPLHVVGSDNTTTLLVESTDADANVGPIIELFRNSGSPADNDAIGRIDFKCDDDAGNASTFARIAVTALDVSNGSEDAKIDFIAATDDAFTPTMSISGGKVGIGTTSPANPLEVKTTGTSTSVFGNRVANFRSDASGRDAHIAFGDNVNASAAIGYSNPELYFYVAGDERLRIKSDGKVGIGTTSPGYKLHVAEGTTDVVASFTSSDANAWIQLRDDDTTDTAVMIGANDDSMMLRAGSNTRMTIAHNGKVGIGVDDPEQELHVYNSATDSSCYIKVQNNRARNAAVQFTTTQGSWYVGQGIGADVDRFMVYDSAEKFSIDANGHAKIHDGNLVIGTSGHGIDFSARQNNQTTGATTGTELLEHYEEGTWTPTFTGSTGNPTLSGQIATGIYTRVGNLVTVTYYSGSFTLSGSPGGTPYIGGLPFAAKSTGNNYATAHFAHTTCFNAAASGYVNNGGSLITVLQTGDTTAGNTWESSGTKYLMVHFTYLAA